MNTEIVIWNECTNNNKTIHLYWDAIIEKWCAFGVSALCIVHWLHKKGCQEHSYYSHEMCMPATLLSNEERLTLTQNALEIKEMTNHYIRLQWEEEANMHSYRDWAQSLLNNEK